MFLIRSLEHRLGGTAGARARCSSALLFFDATKAILRSMDRAAGQLRPDHRAHRHGGGFLAADRAVVCRPNRGAGRGHPDGGCAEHGVDCRAGVSRHCAKSCPLLRVWRAARRSIPSAREPQHWRGSRGTGQAAMRRLRRGERRARSRRRPQHGPRCSTATLTTAPTPGRRKPRRARPKLATLGPLTRNTKEGEMMRLIICLIPLLCGCSAPPVRCDAHLQPHQSARRNRIPPSGRSGFAGAENALITAPADRRVFPRGRSHGTPIARRSFAAAHARAWWVAGAGWLCAVATALALACSCP